MDPYPPEIPVFTPVWVRLDALIDEGRLKTSDQVVEECKKKADGLAEWCEARPDMIVPVEEAINEVTYVMSTYERLVDTVKGKSGADPFVIALAMSGNPYWTVVSEERGGKENSPKMPYVCQQEDVRCIQLITLLREINWGG